MILSVQCRAHVHTRLRPRSRFNQKGSAPRYRVEREKVADRDPRVQRRRQPAQAPRWLYPPTQHPLLGMHMLSEGYQILSLFVEHYRAMRDYANLESKVCH